MHLCTTIAINEPTSFFEAPSYEKKQFCDRSSLFWSGLIMLCLYIYHNKEGRSDLLITLLFTF